MKYAILKTINYVCPDLAFDPAIRSKKKVRCLDREHSEKSRKFSESRNTGFTSPSQKNLIQFFQPIFSDKLRPFGNRIGLPLPASLILAWVWLLFAFPAFGQQESHSALDLANQYYEHGNWKQAILQYESYLSHHPDDVGIRIKIGKSYLAENKIQAALNIWQGVIEENSDCQPEVYFLAGRSFHQLSRYSEAEIMYRRYIDREEDPDLDIMSYYLKQVGAAMSAGIAETKYLIENAGQSVNSPQDEFHPVYSPNIDQRFYYSIHDLERSAPIRSTPPVGSSMKYAEVSQGLWKSQGALDTELVSGQELHLLDFSANGQQVFFTGAFSQDGRITYQKNFEENASQSGDYEWTHPLYQSTLGDRDLFTIHDSAYLFSSRRLKGYGGFDLYVTFKRLGEWVVQNLGPTINTPFDEIAPFLSLDGRKIFFSSNSDKSIGGYDIFFATFDDDMESWTQPYNLMRPLNSGMDDLELRLSPDGREALFSSNRPGGYGGFDIYNVYFEQQEYSQGLISRPKYFYQVRAYNSFSPEGPGSSVSAEKPVYELPVIYFGERSIIVTSKMRFELDRILEYGQLFPHTGLLLNIFTDKDEDSEFLLFKPVLILKNVIDYLETQGFDKSRIQIRLYGNQYPSFTSSKPSEDHTISPVRSPNRRLEFGFTQTENLPVQLGVSVEKLTDNRLNLSPYQKWINRTQNLYFRIQLMETEQLLKDSDFIKQEDLMLAIEGYDAHFTYYCGIFQNFHDAQEALRKYRAKGYEQACIVAYMGAYKMTGDQITSEIIEGYPELKEYIIYQK